MAFHLHQLPAPHFRLSPSFHLHLPYSLFSATRRKTSREQPLPSSVLIVTRHCPDPVLANTASSPSPLSTKLATMDGDGKYKQGMAILKRLAKFSKANAHRKGRRPRDLPTRETVVAHFTERARKSITHGNNPTEVVLWPPFHPPCVLPEQRLQPVMIRDLALDTRHGGKKVLLRGVTSPARLKHVFSMVVCDENDTAMLLQISNLPCDVFVPDAASDAPGRTVVCILKEPLLKMNEDWTYALKVHHPCDVIWVDSDDERVPEKWRQAPLDSLDARTLGNAAVKEGRWHEAQKL